jgi:hypothetical protein
MKENLLKALPEGKRRRDELSSDHAQNENSATSLLTDAPEPRFPDSYVTSFLRSALESFPCKVNYPGMLDSELDDCNSEALPHGKNRAPLSAPRHSQETAKTALENHMNSGFHRQILAERVQSSIENLQIFYEKLSNMVGGEGHGDGGSEGLPNVHDAQIGDSVLPDLQVCNRDREFALGTLDVVNWENHTFGAAGGKCLDEGSWQSWMSQSAQESLTETLTAESLVSRTEEGGESQDTEEMRSPSTADLQDLLSSLQFLLSVLKHHEETAKISLAKTQALREKKEALRLAKQQYKRQRVAECTSYTQSMETFASSAT